MKLTLISHKIEEFVKSANNDELLREKIEKAAIEIRNGEDVQRIISKEIIPVAREMEYEFTTDNFIEYLKMSENKKELSENELDMASGGADESSKFKNKKLGTVALGLTEAAVSIASLTNGMGSAFSPLPNLNKTMSIDSSTNSQEFLKNKESSAAVANGLRSLLFKENGKVHGPEVEEKLIENSNKIEDKNEIKNSNLINVKDTEYKITKIAEIEEERAIIINNSLDEKKVVEIPDEPLTVEGKWLPMGKATYSATVIILPKDIKSSFKESRWKKINQKDGSTVFIRKGSEAYKNQQEPNRKSN